MDLESAKNLYTLLHSTYKNMTNSDFQLYRYLTVNPHFSDYPPSPLTSYTLFERIFIITVFVLACKSD